MAYSDALLEAMDHALAQSKDSVIFGQGADDFKGIFGSTTGLAEKYGSDRVFDMPLMEEGMTGIALGLALNGVYPIITHIRSDFVLLSANQIINLIAKYKYMFGGLYELPMLIRTVVGRSWGQGAQHSQSLQSLFAHIPRLAVFAPASSQAILSTYPYLVEERRIPAITFEHRMLYSINFEVDRQAASAGDSPLTSYKLRDGGDLTIVATSIMVLEALRGAKWLAERGIEADVIDLHCVSHFDRNLILESVRKTGRLLIADTSWVPFGVCAEICRVIMEESPSMLKQPVRTLRMAPAPCPTAKSLEDLFYPNLRDMVDTAARLVHGGPDHKVDLPTETTMSETYKKFRGPF